MPADRAASTSESDAPWIEEVALLGDPAEVEAFFAARPELHDRESVERLTRVVVDEARKNLALAERLSAAAERLAQTRG